LENYAAWLWLELATYRSAKKIRNNENIQLGNNNRRDKNELFPEGKKNLKKGN
jgi:hypothetical protein